MIKYIILPILAIVISSCRNYHLKKADEYLSNSNCEMAMGHLEKVKTKEAELDLDIKRAETYEQCGMTDSAFSVYFRLFERGYKNDQKHLSYGEFLLRKGEFKAAAEELTAYCLQYPSDLNAQIMLAYANAFCQYKIRSATNFDYFYPYNVWSFSRIPWTSIFYRTFGPSYFSNPTQLNYLIKEYLLYGPCTYIDSKHLIYTRPQSDLLSSKDARLYLWEADVVGDSLTNKRKITFDENCTYAQPTYYINGDILYFISDRPGGMGGTDIYFSRKVNGSWTAPQSIGPLINTLHFEIFPYIHEDGTLYFMRIINNFPYIYMAGMNNGIFLKPSCLNCPDILAEKAAQNPKNEYRSSSDIIQVKPLPVQTKIKPVPVKTEYHSKFSGRARFKLSGKPAEGAKIQLIDRLHGDTIILFSDAKGNFNYQIKNGCFYQVICSYEGALTKTDVISTADINSGYIYYADYVVEEYKLNETIILDSIYYDFDSSGIRSDADKELRKLTDFLLDNPFLDVEIGSHTDCRGSFEYNLRLSEARARSVVNYLILNGVDQARLTWRGYGESHLLNHCSDGVTCSEEEHQKNRRTELKITGIRRED